MDADEAMKRIAVIGRADIRQLFDEHGAMLPVQDWPTELALVVRGIKKGELGTDVVFESRLAALKLIALAEGKLSKSADVKVAGLALLLEHTKPEDTVEVDLPSTAAPV